MGLSGLNGQRYSYKFIKYRFCPTCNAEKEDECHYIMYCNTYNDIRNIMINELRNIFTDSGLGAHFDHLLMFSKRQSFSGDLRNYILKLIKNYLIPSSLSLSDANAFYTKLLKIIATLKVTRYLIFFFYFLFFFLFCSVVSCILLCVSSVSFLLVENCSVLYEVTICVSD